MLYGIDLSVANGAVDFTAVAQAGKAFFMQKCSEGTGYLDPTFANNVSAGMSAGLVSGAYHFLHPAQDINAQADFFVQNAFGQVNMPLFVDFETTEGETVSQAIDRADQMLVALQARTGKAPGIYLGENFWNNYPSHWVSYPLWIESYHPITNGMIVDPRVPPPFTHWTFHQYAADAFPGIAAGQVAGVSTAVDLNRFNGSMSDLCSLCDMPPASCGPGKWPVVAAGLTLLGALLWKKFHA